jgi:hypothetical protein
LGDAKGKRKLPQFNAWSVGGGEILSGVEFQFIQWDRQGSQSLNYVTTKLSQISPTLGLERKCKKGEKENISKFGPNLVRWG